MKPRKYKSDHKTDVVSVSMRQAKDGALFYLVDFLSPEGVPMYVTFESMTSVVDFIKSNF